jgi:hypothetical protein
MFFYGEVYSILLSPHGMSLKAYGKYSLSDICLRAEKIYKQYIFLKANLNNFKKIINKQNLNSINNKYLSIYTMFNQFFIKQNLLNFCFIKNFTFNNKLNYNFSNFFNNKLQQVYQQINFYFFNTNNTVVVSENNINLFLNLKLLKVINNKGLHLIFKNYFNLYNYLFLDSTLLFKTSNIGNNLQNKLIAFSSIFLLKNKYYIINNDIYFLDLKYNLNSNYLNIFYFTPITTYTRNIFETNIISRNAVEVQAIIERINNFFSNFK